MSTIFCDIETFHDFFYIGMKREEDGKRIGVEYSTRSPEWDRDWVRNIFLRNTTVGYNSLGYDLPMIWYSSINWLRDFPLASYCGSSPRSPRNFLLRGIRTRTPVTMHTMPMGVKEKKPSPSSPAS